VKPEGAIASLRENGAYVCVAHHSFDVYPGWGQRYVFKHIASNTFWAKDVYMSDDDSEENTHWYEVEPVVTTRYEKKKKQS